MEPRRCRRGKPGGIGRAVAQREASMEPRRCRRGKPHAFITSVDPNMCFNGATTMSSWKTSAVSCVAPVQAWLQWSHDDVVVENSAASWFATFAVQCFNGATTMSSWKTCLSGAPWCSMQRFNGATTMSSWKTWTISSSRIESDGLAGGPLQWSHDDVVVENGPPRGHLQNSGLRGVPREPAASGVLRGGSMAGRVTQTHFPQGFVRRERGPCAALSLTDELPTNLGRECAQIRISRRHRSLRVWRKKIIPRN